MDPAPSLERTTGDPPGCNFRKKGGPREPKSAHAKRIHVELQHGFFFLTFMVFFLRKRIMVLTTLLSNPEPFNSA